MCLMNERAWSTSACCWLAILAMWTGPLIAADFLVTKVTDTVDGSCDSDCSLREAIIAANALSTFGVHEITLPAGTYRLAMVGGSTDTALIGDLDVEMNMRIKGAGAATTIIDAQHIDRVFHATKAALYLEDVTITGGSLNSSNIGGGVFVEEGYLYVTRCIVTDNNVVVANMALGGGLAGSSGLVSVRDSTITANSVTSNYSRGGGIYASGHAPGYSGQIIIINSVVADNTASGLNSAGGGIAIGTELIPGVPGTIVDGHLNMSRCTVSGNHADGGGGGVFVHSPAEGNVNQSDIIDSTISNNSADGGGGIFTGDTMEMVNVTLSGNSATNGGGIFAGGDVTLIHATVTGNVATAGPVIYNLGTLTVGNSILNGACVNVGATTSLDGNLESPGNTCGIGSGYSDRVNVALAQVGLLPLADNGGMTQTHALSVTSIAIDDGVNANCISWPEDQRSIPRPLDGNGNGPATCDKGSFEYGGIMADDFESGDTSLWSAASP